MKKLIMFFGLLFVGAVGWRIGDGLSADALGMAVGVLFGVTAGIPTTLLLIQASRRTEPSAREYEAPRVRESTLVIAGAPKTETHHYHYHIHQAPQTAAVDVVPPAVALAAQRWNGIAQWHSERSQWLIVNPATGRIVARQRKNIAAEPLRLQG